MEISIEQVILLSQALNTLLRVAGIPYKEVYWLDKNRKKLETPIKKWNTKVQEIFDECATQIPDVSFVPMEKYGEFKKALEVASRFETENGGLKLSDFTEICQKFEVKSNFAGSKRIMAKDKEDYEKRLNDIAESWKEELDLTKVTLDPKLEQALEHLPGELQLAVGLIIQEPKEEEVSTIILPKKNVFPGRQN